MLNLRYRSFALFVIFSFVISGNVIADVNPLLEAEVHRYKSELEQKSGKDLIVLADLLSGSGIGDDELYEVVESRTKQEFEYHVENPKDRVSAKVLNSLLRAYASFGREESRSFLVGVVEKSKSRGVRNRAHRLQPKLGWYAERNKLMQDFSGYKAGEDLMTQRYINLLASDDDRLGRWAAEEIDRRKGAENRVYQTLAALIEKNALAASSKPSAVRLDAYAWYCKILARYDAENNKDLLLEIQKNKSYHKKLKKYARFE